MLFGKVLRPPAFRAKLTSRRHEGGRGDAGRDGRPRRRLRRRGRPRPSTPRRKALDAIKAEWQTAPQVVRDGPVQAPEGAAGRRRRGRRAAGAAAAQGSIEDGLKAADKTVKATYTIAYIAHVPLEPRAAVAEWADGKLTVWTGTQHAVRRPRRAGAARSASPQDKVRVIVPDMGSGYGGKHTGEAAVEAARLAKAAGKPVKLVWTREEEFTWAYFRPAGVIEVNAGRDEGRHADRLGVPQLQLRRLGDRARRTRSPNRQTEFHSHRLAAAAGVVPGAGLDRQHLRPRVGHGRPGPRGRHGPAGVPPEEPRRTPGCGRCWKRRRSSSAGARRSRPPGRGFGLACGTEKGELRRHLCRGRGATRTGAGARGPGR